MKGEFTSLIGKIHTAAIWGGGILTARAGKVFTMRSYKEEGRTYLEKEEISLHIGAAYFGKRSRKGHTDDQKEIAAGRRRGGRHP